MWGIIWGRTRDLFPAHFKKVLFTFIDRVHFQQHHRQRYQEESYTSGQQLLEWQHNHQFHLELHLLEQQHKSVFVVEVVHYNFVDKVHIYKEFYDDHFLHTHQYIVHNCYSIQEHTLQYSHSNMILYKLFVKQEQMLGEVRE